MHLSFLKKKQQLCNSELYFFKRSYLSHTVFDFSLTILVYSPVRYCLQMVRKSEFKPEMYVYLF